MSKIISKLSVALVVALFVASAVGQGAEKSDSPGGVRGEILGEVDALEKKYVGLADAIPADKYGWRPGEGVRSVSEVFVHVAVANYRLPYFIGTPPPDALPAEKDVTDKAEVMKHLKGSFEFVRKAVMNMSEDEIEKTSKMFGRDRTYREIGFFLAGHMHEHLGQLIAYSRMNGIVPPWSQG
ncbi:MAG: DinB family protein [Acidobacteria bacterium]|nr:MAG: DinB family protein [Acidobacteriota bacterium]REK02290.1 MAG: DinB family protein [Acidobacteriota bacterium]REK13907.1 MAG: DinB family protein [Acidobacteriota bacterium]REK41901.1 MAG: DinB family protein [Acidobacteriota bacterium]